MFLKLLLFEVLTILFTIHNVAAAPSPPSVDSSGADIVIFHTSKFFLVSWRITDKKPTAQLCCTTYSQCRQKGWEFAKCCPNERACPAVNYQNFFNPLRGGECIVGHQNFKCPTAK
ncbi:hypothetical protein N431DRAFT_548843 [Stipitochalara longipes BDJ]|nr:hypothetical protein N431DRAFT_548843 [Stipitochalara longipes BDJ]